MSAKTDRPIVARLSWPYWAVLNYEIRYITSDARLALIYRALLADDRDAVRAAERPVRLRYKLFEVWRGDECIGRGINPRLPN